MADDGHRGRCCCGAVGVVPSEEDSVPAPLVAAAAAAGDASAVFGLPRGVVKVDADTPAAVVSSVSTTDSCWSTATNNESPPPPPPALLAVGSRRVNAALALVDEGAKAEGGGIRDGVVGMTDDQLMVRAS